MSETLDYAHDVFESRFTGGELSEWEAAFTGKPVAECKATMQTFPKDDRTKITPADFRKAWARRHPPEKCEECAGTGQNWDGERYEFCACPRGEHMRDLNERLLAESVALRPVWAAALPEQARRYDGVVSTLERLCGQCGSPLDEHTDTDRTLCRTLEPKGKP